MTFFLLQGSSISFNEGGGFSTVGIMMVNDVGNRLLVLIKKVISLNGLVKRKTENKDANILLISILTNIQSFM